VTFAADAALPAQWPAGCDVVETTPRVWELRVHGALGPVVSLLATRPIADLDVQMPHLEEVLKKYYSDPDRVATQANAPAS
jgi:hypothetical protein